MKKYILLLLVIGLAACNEGDNKQQESSSEANTEEKGQEVKEMCFLNAHNFNKVDSDFIKLVITGDEVTGEMSYYPYEKDASVGTIKGTIAGDIITLKWTYWQEGMESTEPVVLKMIPENLLQKATAMNEKGEIYVPEDAKYVESYKQVDCSLYEKRKN